MNYGFYLSASGMLNAMHRMEVSATNLANVETTGYKPDTTFVRQRDPERIESNAPIEPQELLERLGGGVLASATGVDLTQGDLKQTDNPLDIALRGKGFFAVRSPQGDPALTRDGRLTMAADGTLVQTATGLPMLDRRNRPITLDPTAAVGILRDGSVVQRGEAVARLNVVVPADPARLQKRGDGMIAYTGKLTASSADVIAGSTESSAVDPVLAINAMMAANRAVGANSKLLQFQDRAMQQAIAVLGKVA
ncbi:MAG: flagellar hook-basal body protein [Phycisphaerales bacterium]|nr:flagellar hook-basal body protein [Phycisphaerales bacterium]